MLEKLTIGNIEAREPIIDQASVEHYQPEVMDRQWLLLTEAMRKEILSHPEARESAIALINSPVDESLPGTFLDSLSSDERVARLKERYGSGIADYLHLLPVPDDQIGYDLRNSSKLSRPQDMAQMLQSIYGADTPKYYEYLEGCVDSGMFLRGITTQERQMIAQRYRFARDVKLLSLQAEVANQEIPLQANDRNEVMLPSGISIHLNVDDEIQKQELLNPQNWKKRRQIKDRVYEIQIGSSTYILKEKKTERHVDTKERGHVSGLTSLEEFQTAQHFQKNGVADHGGIKVSWENPLAVVTFPDGFQFTVFDHEDGIIEENSITQLLSQEIIKYREHYEEEFTLISTMTETFKDDPRVMKFEHGNTESGLSKINAMLMKIGLKSKKQIPKISFEEFSLIKALKMQRQARSLLKEAIIRNNYKNSDLDGYAYRINLQNGSPQLEIIGFDFEYFSKMCHSDTKKRIQRHKDFEQEMEHKDGIGFAYWYDSSPITRMQKAGYFALLEVEKLSQQVAKE